LLLVLKLVDWDSMRRLCAVALAFAVCYSGGCRRPTMVRLAAEEALLERRRQGLEALTAAAKGNGGRIVVLRDALVVVHQDLVQQVLDAALPFEQVVASRYRIEAQKARVQFEDGFASIQLHGKASLADRPGVAAEVTLFSGLDIVELDERSGVLRGGVRVFALEARSVDVHGLGAPAEQLVEDLGKEKLDEFSPLLSSIGIPVRLDDRVTIPSLGPSGGVAIAAAELPVGLAVHDVKSFRHRLWVTLETRASQMESPH
jgi:hypothetical protein